VSPLILIPAAADVGPIYLGAAIVFALVVFVLIIAFATRTAEVALLACGICIAGGGVLGVSTWYLAQSDGPLEPSDIVFLRFLAAVYLAVLVIAGFVARRGWKNSRDRIPNPSRPIASQSTIDGYDHHWLLSQLQKKTAESREKVSTLSPPAPTPDPNPDRGE
jgi:hypothetical protein